MIARETVQLIVLVGFMNSKSNIEFQERAEVICKILSLVGIGLVCIASSALADTMRIVQFGDTQPSTEARWQNMADAIDIINNLEPDIVFHVGDITWFGTASECERASGLLAGIQAPLYIVPGNHDTFVPVDAGERAIPYDEMHAMRMVNYNTHYGEESWSVEIGDFQFIGFDATEVNYDLLPYPGYVYDQDAMVHGPFWPYISETRQQWLLDTCQNSSKPYKFLVIHYPSVCHRCILTHNNPYHGRDPYPITPDHIDYTLGEAGIIGQMFGHRHLLEAGQDPTTGQLMFDSCTTIGGGVMYFDVTDNLMSCFWKPISGGAVQSMGSYNLDTIRATVAGKSGLLTVVSATASSEYPDGRNVVDIINGNGMDMFGLNTHHIGAIGTMWLSLGTDPAGEWVEFDLGGLYNLIETRIWNYNERVVAGGLPDNWTHGRGVYNMDILVAGDDHEFSHFSNVNLNESGDGLPVFDTVALEANGVRYVKFDINSNLASLYPDSFLPAPGTHNPSYVGLSEVMFVGEEHCTISEADGDLDGNCEVNLSDFVIFAANWLLSGNSP